MSASCWGIFERLGFELLVLPLQNQLKYLVSDVITVAEQILQG